MEGGGTRLERKTDVGCLGQRKGEAARRKRKKKQSKLRGIPGRQARGVSFLRGGVSQRELFFERDIQSRNRGAS